MILGRCGGVDQSREDLARPGICCSEVTVCGAATGKTDVQHRVSSMQPGPGFGVFFCGCTEQEETGQFL